MLGLFECIKVISLVDIETSRENGTHTLSRESIYIGRINMIPVLGSKNNPRFCSMPPTLIKN